MGAELGKAYVQIVPSAEGISGSISKVLGGEAASAGKLAGKGIAASMTGAITAGIAALGIGKVIGSAIASGTEFQTSVAKLGTIADQSALSIDDMKSRIAEMSDEMGISQAKLAEAAYSTISATGDTAGALDIVSQAAKLATAGFTDTDSAISVLTTSLNAYGLEAEDVEHISDSLVTTQNLGVTTVAELASNMGRAIATASGYNVSLENLEAAYIGTTKSGISTAESTTYLSSMMAELGKKGSKVSDIIKDKTGQSFAKLMDDGSSLADVLGILYDSCNGDSEAFMNLWGSQEAGKAANAIVNQGLETFNENLGTLQDQAGTTETAYSQMTDTFAWKSQDLQTKIENLGISLFENIYPVLDELIGKAMEFVDSMDVAALSDQISGFIGDIVPLVTTLGDILVGVAENLDIILPVVSALMGFSIASKLTGLVTGILGLFSGVEALAPVIAALTGPVGIIIALVGAAIAAVTTLWTTNEGFRDAVINAWEAVKSFLASAWENIKSAAETAWNQISSTVTGILTGIQTAFSDIWNSITAFLSDAWETIKNTVQVGIMFIQELISAAVSIITLPWRMIWENCKGALTAAWDAIKKTVSSALESIRSKISSVWNAIKGVLLPIINTIQSGVSTAWNKIREITSSVMNAVKSVMSSVWNNIKSTLSNIMTGIKNTVSTTWNNIKSAISSAIDGIKSKISSGLSAAKSTVTSIFDSIKSKITGVMDSAKSAVANAIQAIKNKFNFSWSLPKLKLPHLSISGKFGINPPSVPHFGIDWYDKGGIFDSPAVIGVAEKRPEFVGALDDLRGIVREESGAGSSAEMYMERMLELMNRYLPQAAAGKNIVMDTGKLVGVLAGPLDEELGYRESIARG